MRSDREEPDEMPHYASFRQGLHYSLKKNLQRNEIFGINTMWPLDIYNGPS